MKVYFTNDSKQKKTLMESDYAEDIYDVVIAFFEEHHTFPHFLHLEKKGDNAQVSFGSMTEFFVIEDLMDEDYEELEELFRAHDI